MDKIKLQSYVGVCFAVFVLSVVTGGKASKLELKCYQCERNTSTDCKESDLKSCATFNDRCVTHISRNTRDGFKIKRECGLAPCSFDDDMVEKGLGFQCDQSRPEFSCVYCCKDSGCNRNGADIAAKPISMMYLIIAFNVLFLCLLNVARDFIPPYVQENKKG